MKALCDCSEHEDLRLFRDAVQFIEGGRI